MTVPTKQMALVALTALLGVSTLLAFRYLWVTQTQKLMSTAANGASYGDGRRDQSDGLLPGFRGNRLALVPSGMESESSSIQGVFRDASGTAVAGCRFEVDRDVANSENLSGVTDPLGQWSFEHDPAPNEDVPAITFHLHQGITATYYLEDFDYTGSCVLTAPSIEKILVRLSGATGVWGFTIKPIANEVIGQQRSGSSVEYRYLGGFGQVIVRSRTFSVTQSRDVNEVAVMGLAGTSCEVQGWMTHAETDPVTQEVRFPGVAEFRLGQPVPGVSVRVAEPSGSLSDVSGTVVFFYEEEGTREVSSPIVIPIEHGESYFRIHRNNVPSYYNNRDRIREVVILDDGERIAVATGRQSFDVRPHQIVTVVRGTGTMPVRVRGRDLDKVVSVHADFVDQGIRTIPMKDMYIAPPWCERYRRVSEELAEITLASDSWYQIWMVGSNGMIGSVDRRDGGEFSLQWPEVFRETEVPLNRLLAGVGESSRSWVWVEAQLQGRANDRWVRVDDRVFRPGEFAERGDWTLRMQVGVLYRTKGVVTEGRVTTEVGPIDLR